MKRAIRILFAFVAGQFLFQLVGIFLSARGVDIGGWGMALLPQMISLLSLIGVIGTPVLSFIYYRANKKLETEFTIYSFICLCIWAIYIFGYFAFSGLGDGGLF